MRVCPELILGVHVPPGNLGRGFTKHVPPEFVPNNHGDILKPIKRPDTNDLGISLMNQVKLHTSGIASLDQNSWGTCTPEICISGILFVKRANF